MKYILLVFISVALFAGCKSQKCGAYYDKMKECDIPTFNTSRDEFVEKCKEAEGNDKYLECAEETSCQGFIQCVENK